MRYPTIKLTVILVGLLLMSSYSFAQHKFYYPANQNTYALEQVEDKVNLPSTVLQYLTDSSGMIEFQEITTETYRKSFKNKVEWEKGEVLWVRFSLFNRSTQDGNWLLLLPHADRVNAFIHYETNQFTTAETGLLIPPRHRTYSKGFIPKVAINIPSNKAVTIYLKLAQSSTPYPSFDWKLENQSAWEKEHKRMIDHQQHLQYAFSIIALIVGVMLFIRLKTGLTLYLIATIALFGYFYLTIQEQEGMLNRLLFHYILIQVYLLSFSSLLHQLSITRFNNTIFGSYLIFRILSVFGGLVYLLFKQHELYWDGIHYFLIVISCIDGIFSMIRNYQSRVLLIASAGIFIPWLSYLLAAPYASYMLQIGTCLGYSLIGVFLVFARKE